MKGKIEKWVMQTPGGKFVGFSGTFKTTEMGQCVVCGRVGPVNPHIPFIGEGCTGDDAVLLCWHCIPKVIKAGVKAIMQRPRKTGRRRT